MTDYEINKLAKAIVKRLPELIIENPKFLDIIIPPKYMNIEEAAEFLKMPVCTIYQKVDEIPHTKNGKRLVFSDRALVQYMERQS